MKKSVEFFSPADGDLITNPDPLFLKILFLYVGSEYWSSGSGDAYLDYDDSKLSSRLEIIFHANKGFYLRYQSPEFDVHSLGDNSKSTESVKVHVGGDPVAIAARFFVDRKKAFEIAAFFCVAGLKSDSIEWSEEYE